MWLLLAQEHDGAEIDPRLLTDPANVAAALWAWGIFVLLVVLLGRFAWGPITKGLAAREQRIAESLKKAEEVEKAAREIQETNRKLLAEAQQEAQKIVAEARVAAKHAESDILAKAAAEVETQRERFKRETDLMVEKARADLRRETVDLTLEATARLVGRTLTDADHRRLAEQALHDAEATARN